MRTSFGIAGSLIVCAVGTIAGGCGVGKPVGVQNADSSSVPTMPTPISGTASLAGRVQDADGNGVPGATIKVAEIDQKKATSDAQGLFQMDVPSDSTLTLMTTAPGFAPSYRESIVLSDQAVVANFDVLVLPVETVGRLDALAGADKVATRGLMAVRLHSLTRTCVLAGAQVSIWPPQAATVMYGGPNPAGGLEEPGVGTDRVQADTGIAVWLVGVLPPGNMLRIDVKQTGCTQLAASPSMGGMLFPGLRKVDVQALTQADLFFE